MKLLLVGSGAREHALARALRASSLCEALYIAPGNAGTEELGTNLAIDAEDINVLTEFAVKNHIDFVVVGPETPLVMGLVDQLQEKGIKAFGPSANAAVLEGSKGFMKDFCARHHIPTAAYGRFFERESALQFINEKFAAQPQSRIVIKADGLAAGKGVVIAQNIEEAKEAVHAALIDKKFGDAGNSLVIEEFMEGEEVSFFAIADGKTVLPLASAQDHKAVGEGDTGPNTGGMGAYSPAPCLTPALEQQVMETIIAPTLAGMAAENREFKGILFAGLMLVKDNITGKITPKLLEYNVRFGDPECQVVLSRLKSDVLELMLASCDGKLADFDIKWHDHAALTVVMAAKGYPDSYLKGTEINGLEKLAALSGVTAFHGGTKRSADKKLQANGGRVLSITAEAPSISEAQKRAYRGVDLVDWPDGFYRRDIGWRAIKG
ncbi:MAG: phosphoribosylamine--glycine ligase [Alphaproteobacteria bacterium]